MKIHASIAVVVVLPCVPLTTIEHRPGRNSSSRISGSDGMESCGQALPPVPDCLGQNVPITTRSGAGVKFAASKSWKKEIPKLIQQCRGGG